MIAATAVAHPNIALVKYWGKRDIPLNLPAVPSLSLTLGRYRTRTTVRPASQDRVLLQGQTASPSFTRRALGFLDTMLGERPPLLIDTENNFPVGAGLASSASGFAALTLAAASSAGLDLDRPTLSAWARRGSGSACRSLFGGFALWRQGVRPDGTDSVAESLLSEHAWDVRMVVAVVSEAAKAVGSTAGMERSRATSALYETWVRTAAEDVDEAVAAIESRDLERLGTVMERSTFKMHATMHSATPPLLYWQPATVAALHAVFGLRERGIGAWATMDAGPQVKVLCHASDADAVSAALADVALRVDILPPGGAAHLEPNP